MAGTLVVDTIQSGASLTPPTITDSAGTQIGTLCRAWVNFNGTTSPGTIRASFNVTSVTKNGTGDYTVNFTNAMPDANYAVTQGYTPSTSQAYVGQVSTLTTTSVRMGNYLNYSSGAALDMSMVGVAIFR